MSIFFCTPCYGGHATTAYLRSYGRTIAELSQAGLDFDWHFIERESLVQRARNAHAAAFLKTDYRKLMFIDADIQWQPEDIAALWNLDADIAVGFYAMKIPGGDGYSAWIDGKLVHGLDQYDGPVEVDYAGTGFMMIDRKVFEAVREADPSIYHRDGKPEEDRWAFFDCSVIDDGGGPFYCSEDYWICRAWRKLGGKILGDPKVRLIHWGTYPYGASPNKAVWGEAQTA